MWEAINTFHLGLLQRNISAAVQTGPYSVYAYVRERCGLFWGVTSRTMLRDEAHAFLQAGAAIESADMVLRMLRVALPTAEGEDNHLLDGQALALLQAVGGFQAYRRSVPAPPNARPVARFLLFERDYPDSVAFSIEALHLALTAADPSYRSSPAVLRLSRLMADLDFRARSPVPDASLAGTLGDRPGRARARRFRHRPAVLWQPRPARRAAGAVRMNFAIRYLTEYRYSGPVTDNLNALRVKPATLSNQTVEDFVVRVDPETRLNQHLDYFGTTVIEFGISRPHEHLSIDVRARVRTTSPDVPPETDWVAIEDRAYDAAAGEFLLLDGSEPDDVAIDDLVGLTRTESPLGTVQRLVEAIPDRFEYRAGVTYVGSTVGDLLAAGAGVCQDFAHLALLLLRRHGIGARYVSGYLWAPSEDEASAEVETHAWVEALLPGPDGLAWVGLDPTNRTLGGESHVKIGHGRHYADVPPIKGVYRGTADSELSASVRMTRGDMSP